MKSTQKPKNQPVETNQFIFYGLLFLTLILAAFFRIWYLDRIPSGLVSDELDYVLNAKAMYHTGSSIMTKDWSPWSLTTVPNEVPKAEFPYVISLPFVGPMGLSLFSARIGYALVSIVYVLFVALTARVFLGNWIGIASGVIAAINPWSVYFGRTAYDVPIAITAYLATLYLVAKLKGPSILFSIVPLTIAFYSYIGTKVLFIPYIIISLFGVWLTVHKRKDTIYLGLVGVFALVLFGSFMINLRSLDTNARINQIFTPFHQSIISTVDSQRRLTISSPLTRIFANKPIVYLKEVVIKYFGAFSPSILFTNGEGIATFSLWEHGLFYPHDAVFLLIGIGVMFTAYPTTLLFFAGLISVATLPSILSTVGTSYVHRSSLMYPFLTIIIGSGIIATIRWTRKNWRIPMTGAIVLIYVIAVANFTYLYFFRFPYYNSEAFGLSQRLYSRYTALANTHNIPVINISAGSSEGYFRNYLFYNNIPTEQTIPAIRNVFSTKAYIWDNATFTDACPTTDQIASGTITYILSNASPCKEEFINQPMIAIPSLSDGGTLYMLFNDRVCHQYALSEFPTGFTMKDFAVESLSEKQFCERFLIRYTQPLYLPQDIDGKAIKSAISL